MKTFSLQMLCLVLFTPLALAQTPHETWIHPGAPTAETIQSWSKTPGTRSVFLQMQDPATFELEALEKLQGADRLMISTDRFPNESTFESWKRLARTQKLDFVAMNSGLPLDEEITRLNQIGLKSILFVLPYYPDPEEAARLSHLQVPVAFTFAASALPRFLDRDGLRAIPAQVPLLFVSEYWPWYTHMDVLNMTPHDKRIRVRGALPSPESLQYLHAIHNLKEVALETEVDLQDAGLWASFRSLPVEWISVGRVPSRTALDLFGAAARRHLTIDSDQPLTPEEKSALQNSPVPVEWIHLAPGARHGMRTASHSSNVPTPWLVQWKP